MCGEGWRWFCCELEKQESKRCGEMTRPFYSGCCNGRASSFLPHSSPPLIFLIFSFHTLSVTVGKVRAKESKNLQKSKRDLVLFLYSFSPLFSFEHPLYQTLGMKAEDWRASFRTKKIEPHLRPPVLLFAIWIPSGAPPENFEKAFRRIADIKTFFVPLLPEVRPNELSVIKTGREGAN